MDKRLAPQNYNYSTSHDSYNEDEGGLELGELINIIRRKLLVIAGFTLTITSFAFLKLLITPPVYDASFEMLSESLNIESSLTSSNYNEISKETRQESISLELDPIELKILSSPKLISQVVEPLKEKYPEISYQNIVNDLTVEIKETSEKRNILLVAYKHADEKQVLDVIDRLAQVYEDYSLQKRQAGINRAISFVDGQIPKVASQVNKLENQINDLRSKYSFIDPNISIDRITNQLDTLSQEKEKVVAEYQELTSKVRNLDRELGYPNISSTTAIELGTPRYLELLNQLRDIDVEIGRKSAIFTNNSIEIQTLKQEKQQITALILKEGETIRQKLNNQIQISNTRQQYINKEISTLQSTIRNWSAISKDFEHLQEELSIQNSKLSEFELQKDALLVDKSQQESPWKPLNSEVEAKIAKTNFVNDLLLSSALGLLVGVGVSILWENSQKIVYTCSKVEKISKLPILASIPYNFPSDTLSPIKANRILPSKESRLVTSAQPFEKPKFSNSIEAFRSLAANLNLFSFNNNLDELSSANLNSIVITSATPGEGKSTVALNFAKAYASLGKKVLLVDTDVRSIDSLTKSLGFEFHIGLIDILSQNSANLGLKYIQKVPSEENLFVLASGASRIFLKNQKFSSSRLLASAEMYGLMDEFNAHFDLVIYDLCAINGFADVSLLAGKTDGIIVVAGLGKVQTTKLTEALKQLRSCQAPVLGIAVNQVVNKG